MNTERSTAVDATAMSMEEMKAHTIQLRNQDIIDELNQFYIDVTGEGLSEERKAELMEKDLESLIAIGKELKWSYSFINMCDDEKDDSIMWLEPISY